VASREQLCSAVILRPKWSNTKLVFIHQRRAKSLVTWLLTLMRTEVDVLITQISLISAPVLGNLCKYHKFLKSVLWATVFRRQYGSVFNHIIGHQNCRMQ